ncbi:hypothetical protein BMR85_018590 [Achromobacter sp. KAs 3-5]|nr:hypothetical protein BMR85_018590 [Achromobacter sp. KAs 3-5]
MVPGGCFCGSVGALPDGLAALAAGDVADVAADLVAAGAADFAAGFSAGFSEAVAATPVAATPVAATPASAVGTARDAAGSAGARLAFESPSPSFSFTAAALMPQRLAIVATLRPASDIPRKVLSLHAAHAPAGVRKASVSNAHANAPGLHSVMTSLPHLGAPGQNHARLDHECGLA